MKDQLPDRLPTQERGLDFGGLPVDARLEYGRQATEWPIALVCERYFVFLRRKWWLIVGSVLLFLPPAVAYVCWWPMSYEATARMWVAGRVSLQDGAVYEEQPMTFEETQVGLLESETIRSRALARLRQNPGMSLPAGADDDHTPFRVRVTQIRNGGLLELSGKGPTAESVKAFLNAVMDEFLLYKKEARNATSGDTYASVAGDAGKQQEELKMEQDKLSAYGRDNNMVIQEQQAQAAGNYLSQLLTEFAQLRMQFELIDRNLVAAQQPSGPESNLLAPGTGAAELNEPGLALSGLNEYITAQEEVQKLKLTRAQLSQDLRPAHPRMIKLDAEIARDEELLEYSRELERGQLAAMRENLKRRMDIMQETIKDWEAKVGTASERIAEFQRLKNNVDRVQAVQDHLLNLLQSVDMGMRLNSQKVAVLDRPAQAKPTKLPALVVLPLAVFLGLCAGILLILLAQRFSDLVTSTEDLHLWFDEWIMGQVPNLPNGKGARQLQSRASGEDQGFGESFRNLRSALLFGADIGQKARILMVTSATPDEGKSTVAVHLASALASAGSRVLLIDGDLRCGRLHELFQLPPKEGMAELLAQGGDAARFIAPTSIPNLFFLPRGKTAQPGGELFLCSRFDLVLKHGREHFDYVILDSIPIFAADDSTSAAPQVDGVLFVVRGSFVGAGTIRRALEQLYKRHATILGLILNRVNGGSSFYRYNKYDKYYGVIKAPGVACEVSVGT